MHIIVVHQRLKCFLDTVENLLERFEVIGRSALRHIYMVQERRIHVWVAKEEGNPFILKSTDQLVICLVDGGVSRNENNANCRLISHCFRIAAINRINRSHSGGVIVDVVRTVLFAAAFIAGLLNSTPGAADGGLPAPKVCIAHLPIRKRRILGTQRKIRHTGLLVATVLEGAADSLLLRNRSHDLDECISNTQFACFTQNGFGITHTAGVPPKQGASEKREG